MHNSTDPLSVRHHGDLPTTHRNWTKLWREVVPNYIESCRRYIGVTAIESKCRINTVDAQNF